jgi:hypothetical protein
MRVRTPYTPVLFLFSCVFALQADAGATVPSSGFSQLDAIAAAQMANKTGSDQSLQSSTTNAMTALMELANQNRTAAISKGYQAFGQYRNSGDLDGLRLRNAISALKMDSIGNYINSNKSSIFMAPISDFDTTYGRLDPKFLRQGDAGKVADQFEKSSGMSRETFLKKMTAASESDLKVTDPQLVDKVLGRFESFVKDIPNAEFRDKIQAQIDSVPQTVRSGLIGQAVQKATQLLAGATGAPSASDIAAAAKDKGRALASVDAAASTNRDAKAKSDSIVATAEKPKAADNINALANTTTMAPLKEFTHIDNDKFGADAVGNVLQTAVDEQGGDDTIFKQISRKYRSLTASLKQQTM